MLNRCLLSIFTCLPLMLATPRLVADEPTPVPMTAAEKPAEGPIDPFLGEARFELQQGFTRQRFPNVVVALDGTVVTSWGRDTFTVRRSEDGGESWGPEIAAEGPGFHGGGLLVDETTGDNLAFAHNEHPPSPLTVYRSTDHGQTWHVQENVVIHKDIHGNILAMHMSETGITSGTGLTLAG